jgi:hypothetical protein
MDMPNSLLSNDVLGWAAALLTLMTFVCRDMRRLRLLALAANAAFIAYGALAHLLPVLALHLALVPVNLWRLNQTMRPVRRRDDATLSMTPLDPVLARVARPRRGWTHERRRRAGASRTVSTCASANRQIRPDPAFADVPAIRP